MHNKKAHIVIQFVIKLPFNVYSRYKDVRRDYIWLDVIISFDETLEYVASFTYHVVKCINVRFET